MDLEAMRDKLTRGRGAELTPAETEWLLDGMDEMGELKNLRVSLDRKTEEIERLTGQVSAHESEIRRLLRECEDVDRLRREVLAAEDAIASRDEEIRGLRHDNRELVKANGTLTGRIDELLSNGQDMIAERDVILGDRGRLSDQVRRLRGLCRDAASAIREDAAGRGVEAQARLSALFTLLKASGEAE